MKNKLNTFWSSYKEDIIYIGILASIIMFLFFDFIFSNKMLFGSDQLAALGSRVYYKDAFLNQGVFPNWLNGRLGGMPTADALTGDAMYPPSILFKLFFDYYRASSFLMISHIFISGLGFYILCIKSFKVPKVVSFIGAASFMLSPAFFTLIYSGHDSKLFVISLSPFLIWRLLELTIKPNFNNTIYLSLLIALSILTGHVQMVYFILWGLFFIWVYSLVKIWKSDESNHKIIKLFYTFWLANFIGLAIGSIQIYPAYNFIQNQVSVRGVDRGFDFAASWSLHWPEFFSLIIPEYSNVLSNYWSENPFKLNSEYIGFPLILLAIFALISKPSAMRIFWMSFGMFILLFSMGSHTPIFTIAYYLIPGVDKFRACSMIFTWTSFSIVLLATFFLKDIYQSKNIMLDKIKQQKANKFIYVTLMFVILVGVIFSNYSNLLHISNMITDSLNEPRKLSIFEINFNTKFSDGLSFWVISSIATLSLIWLKLKSKISLNKFLLALSCLIIIDQTRINKLFIQTENPEKYTSIPNSIQKIQSEMKVDPFRIFMLPGSFSIQNIASLFSLQGVSGFHDNELKWYRAFRGDQRNFNYLYSFIQKDNSSGKSFLNPNKIVEGNNFLNIANVKYIFLRNHYNQLIRLSNKNYIPRFSFVTNYSILTEAEILKKLHDPSHNSKTHVLLEKPPLNHIETDSSKENLQFNYKYLKNEINHREISFSNNIDGILRISEVYYSDWELILNGQKVTQIKADVAWMAIPVKSGNNNLILRPKSTAMELALKISLATILLLVLVFIMKNVGVFKSFNKPYQKNGTSK
jgi:hypothetical protein